MRDEYSTPKRATTGLPGQRYGRLVVLGEAEPKLYGKRSNRRVYVRCDCGGTKELFLCGLKSGLVKSCGCYHKEQVTKSSTTHGLSYIPGYQSYKAMIRRCSNPKDPSYLRYGAKGISVCKRWLGPGGFANFTKDMGHRPEGKTLDRENNDAGNSPDNCRWATAKEQQRNTGFNRLLTFDGRTQCTSAWAEELGIQVSTLNNRLVRGWSVERTLSEPVRAHVRKRL